MANNQITLDGRLFIRHLKYLRSAWERNKWSVDAFAIIEGTNDNQVIYSKTKSIQHWLCGYELTDTLMVICKDSVYVLTSVIKERLFVAMQNTFDEQVNLKLLKRNKKEGDYASFKTIIDAIKLSYNGNTVGSFLSELQNGPFAKEWKAALSAANLHEVEVSSQISEILSIKDPNEQKCIRTASSISVAVLKSFLVQKIEDIIDEEKSVSHATIAAETEYLFENPQKISRKLNPNVVESCYTPIIQSVGSFNLDLCTPNTDRKLDYSAGTIICSLGARYKAYCSDVARTYFIDPTDDQKETYNLLCEIHERILKLLKPGTKLRDIWRRSVEYIESKMPSLKQNFLPSCGTSIGLEYSDAEYTIDEQSDKVVVAFMVFNLRVGFRNLKKANSNVTYAMLLSDTVLVTDTVAEILTKITKKFSEVSYEIGPGEEDKKENIKLTDRASEKTKIDTRRTPDPSIIKQAAMERKQAIVKEEYAQSSGFSLRKKEKLNTINIGQRTLRSTAAREMKHNKSSTAEVRRREHQKLLEKQLIKRAKRLMNKKEKDEEEGPQTKEYIAYASPKDFPSEASRDIIHVDITREAILLPMYGLMVPFHITTVKNISKNDDYIRVIFKHPGATQITGGPQPFVDPAATFIKELTYRVPNVNSLNNTIRQVNELKKRFNTRETEIHTKATLKEQPPLILSRTMQRIPRLSHLSIRPSIGGRRTIGTLEAHTNGFRYSSKNSIKVDIIYENIKHAFFQHAENSLIVAVHFHLHNEIMIGKKKTKDLQCYMEVMEVSTALSQPRPRSRYGDAEEIEDEQKERELRNKLNRDFQSFVKKVEEIVPNLEFDIPYRELGFWGVHYRNNVFLTPTVHCLINVIENPFFVMSLDDVQIAYFERVQFNLRAFDLVFIFNDWSQKEVHINSIPIDSLETIKEWLDSCNIKYYQGPTNLNWRGLLDVAAANPKKFWADGGWAVVDNSNDSGDEQDVQEDNEQNGPDEYRPSDSDEGDYEMESSYEDDEGKGKIDDEEFNVSSVKEPDDGLDWDMLDKITEKQDIKAAIKRKVKGAPNYDSDEERREALSKRPRRK